MLRRSKDQKGSFYQVDTLKKYYYTPKDKYSRDLAKFKALKQATTKKGAGITDSLTSFASSLFNKVKDFLSGPRNHASPEIRDLIKNHGTATIKKITICRAPIAKVLDSIINFLSLGYFSKAKQELKYDDMFHLFMFIELSDGYKFRIEKNEVVKLTSNETSKDQECIKINIDKDITLVGMFDRATQLNKDFWNYDAVTNNCQDFILAMLKSSGLGSQEDYKFIKQDAVTLFSKLPKYVGKLGKIATNLGGTIDKVLRGTGKKRNKY